MPFFEYTVSDKVGKISSGEMEAIEKQVVLDFLRQQDYLVVSIKAKSPRLLLGSLFGGRISNLDKINFTGNLATMLKAGVGLPEAIEVISEDSTNQYFRKVLGDVRFSLENGRPLSEALKNFKNDFNEVFINLIRAGEASGKLVETLGQLNKQLKKDYALISKIRGALAYPAVLILGVIGVLILLMTFVLPRLVTIFSSSSLKLPLSTKIIFAISRVLSFKPYLTMGIILVLMIVLVILLRKTRFRLFLNRLFFHLPIFAKILKELEFVRFSRTLGNLLSSGIPIVEGLEITAGSMGLAAFKEKILQAKEAVTKGVSLANSFRTEKLFPALLSSVLRVGEKTGELDRLLLEMADFYEEQVDNSLRNFTGLLEPILLIIVGVLIGGMAISIILPIYQLIGSIQ